ncbi:MAG TPA: LamG domain-containing protein [Sedimentisphaerales bacterium]|jgi:hypothetical protein|nr:LamG domain-containing protein [Sedimentisphaerales bacterium]HNU31422.1 LamG domain-containing protein [Sedimentisphaerales bacterium]
MGTAASGWPSSTRRIRCTRPSVPPSQRNSTFVAVVATYDGSRIALYVDGDLDASRPAWGRIRTNDSPVVIGDNAEQAKRYWNGWIDDVRICSYALSKNEIVELFKAGQQSVTSSR